MRLQHMYSTWGKMISIFQLFLIFSLCQKIIVSDMFKVGHDVRLLLQFTKQLSRKIPLFCFAAFLHIYHLCHLPDTQKIQVEAFFSQHFSLRNKISKFFNRQKILGKLHEYLLITTVDHKNKVFLHCMCRINSGFLRIVCNLFLIVFLV